MRWPSKKIPQKGDIRVIKKFLFLPKCLDDEWRWLEIARIKQVAKVSYCDGDIWWWKSLCWYNTSR